MNGYNDFQYNMAAGAGACEACLWLVPGSTSGPSRHQHWESYASIQATPGRAATAPLKSFRGNYCSSAMNSFNVVGNTAPCLGIGPNDPTDLPAVPHLPALRPAEHAADLPALRREGSGVRSHGQREPGARQHHQRAARLRAGRVAAEWTRSYDPGTGILTVTMTLAPFADQFGAARAAGCGPASFCTWNGSACVCALDPSDPPAAIRL